MFERLMFRKSLEKDSKQSLKETFKYILKITGRINKHYVHCLMSMAKDLPTPKKRQNNSILASHLQKWLHIALKNYKKHNCDCSLIEIYV